MNDSEKDLVAHSYAGKSAHYFSGARADLLARLPVDPAAVILEIGCGSGATGALALATKKCGIFYGVEIDRDAAARAQQVLTDVFVGNVENLALPVAPDALDVIIISEVLEHLLEPWSLVARLRTLLKPGGRILATSPNVSHWRVIAQLGKGRFEYVEMGVMDKTHLRWFTPLSYAAMFEQAGFVIDYVGPSGPSGTLAKTINTLTGGSARHLFCTQIALFGHKPA